MWLASMWEAAAVRLSVRPVGNGVPVLTLTKARATPTAQSCTEMPASIAADALPMRRCRTRAAACKVMHVKLPRADQAALDLANP